MIPKLLIRGPTDYDDFDYVKKKLDRLTRTWTDAVLIDDTRPGKEWGRYPSTFPMGYMWMEHRWKVEHLTSPKWPAQHNRFTLTERHHLDPDKKIKDAVSDRRKVMVRLATHMVAFWTSKHDEDTNEFIRLAKIVELKLRVIRT